MAAVADGAQECDRVAGSGGALSLPLCMRLVATQKVELGECVLEVAHV